MKTGEGGNSILFRQGSLISPGIFCLEVVYIMVGWCTEYVMRGI